MQNELPKEKSVLPSDILEPKKTQTIDLISIDSDEDVTQDSEKTKNPRNQKDNNYAPKTSHKPEKNLYPCLSKFKNYPDEEQASSEEEVLETEAPKTNNLAWPPVKKRPPPYNSSVPPLGNPEQELINKIECFKKQV